MRAMPARWREKDARGMREIHYTTGTMACPSMFRLRSSGPGQKETGSRSRRQLGKRLQSTRGADATRCGDAFAALEPLGARASARATARPKAETPDAQSPRATAKPPGLGRCQATSNLK